MFTFVLVRVKIKQVYLILKHSIVTQFFARNNVFSSVYLIPTDKNKLIRNFNNQLNTYKALNIYMKYAVSIKQFLLQTLHVWLDTSTTKHKIVSLTRKNQMRFERASRLKREQVSGRFQMKSVFQFRIPRFFLMFKLFLFKPKLYEIVITAIMV